MRHTLGGAALHDVHPCVADDVPAVLLNDKAPPHGFCRPCGGVAYSLNSVEALSSFTVTGIAGSAMRFSIKRAASRPMRWVGCLTR